MTDRYTMQIGALEGKTDTNYEVAAKFYKERKNKFLNQMKPQLKERLEKFYLDKTYEKFMDSWKNFQERIIKEVEKKSVNELEKGGKRYFQLEGQTVDTGLSLKDFIVEKNGQKEKKETAQMKTTFAIPFEKALTSFFNKNIFEVTEGVNDFIAEHTGNITQEGFTFKGERAIRSDFVFKSSGSEIPQNMELQVKIETNEDGVLSTKEVQSALQEYLQEKGIVAGISVKNYSNNIAYTQSLRLMEELNKELREQDVREAKYADLYMRYFLSKYVIAITSPTVVGLLTPKEFTWMDELLEKSRYYFHLRQDVNKESLFYIENSSIYLSHKSSARKYSSLLYQGRKRQTHTISGHIKS